MSETTGHIHQSVFKALLTDEALNSVLSIGRVFDVVPENAPLPYLVIGRSISSDWSTATEGGRAHTLFIHLWSASSGRSEIHTIEKLVCSALTNLSELDDDHLVNFRFQLSETRRDAARDYFHTVLRFRAVTEPR